MSTQRNRPGTAEGTEATVVLEVQSTASSSAKHYPNVPPINQLIADEVELFFKNDQTQYTSGDVEAELLYHINTRILTEMKDSGLKGAMAYRTLKVLPPFVIAACIFKRDHPHLGLFGESRETARLYTYCGQGSDAGLYVPAEFLVRQAALSYNVSATSRDLDEVLRRLEDSVPMLEPSEDGDVVALANGLFDLRTKELHPFSPEVVLLSKCAVAFNPKATQAPVIDGWDVDCWMREIADEDAEVEQLLGEVVAALFRPGHAFEKAVFLYSESGSNGKGTYLEMLRSLAGAERVASLALSYCENRFLPSSFEVSFGVLSDECEVGGYLEKAKILKSWLSHDWIPFERKNRDLVKIKGRGLCVFCVNELPESKDKTESLYRRLLLVPFKRRYVGTERNPLIKHDYLKRREVLEYVAHKALMMPLFETFCEPKVSRELLGETRVENDPVLQFAEEFLPQFRWELLPWQFLYAMYSAWMRKEVPSGRPVSRREFTKRFTNYVEATPSCGWLVPRGEDGRQKTVRTCNKILGEEPLAVEYDITNWFDMRPVNGSVRKIGLPHNMPVSTRGLLRANVVLTDDDTEDDTDEDVQPALAAAPEPAVLA